MFESVGGSGGNSLAKTGQKNAKISWVQYLHWGRLLPSIMMKNMSPRPCQTVRPVCVSYSYDDPECTDQGFITTIPTLGMAVKK